MPRRSAPSLAVLLLAGCPPPSASDANFLTGGEQGSGGGASDAMSGSTDASSSSTGGATGEAATTAEGSTTGAPGPEFVPRIVEAKFTPAAIDEPGVVKLAVQTEHVEWIESQLDGEPLELVKLSDDEFVGEVAVVSELSDGTHAVKLRPFAGQDEGETVWREFTSDLPQAGSEQKWEANTGLGEGLAGALIPGPNGELFEFGTLDPAGLPRCYLRRRNPDGSAGPADVIEVQPGKRCTGVDTAVEPDGRLLLLSEVEELGIKSWRLDRHDPWNHSLSTLMSGSVDARANAVAVAPGGEIAVCGSKPTEAMDRDAAAWTFNPGHTLPFDLVYDGQKFDNLFTEEANDCAFVGHTLVLAGEANGTHPGDLNPYTRHMVIEYDIYTEQTVWTVASAGQGTLVQSGATAIAAAGPGRYVTAGYVCEEKCVPTLELREFELGGMPGFTYPTKTKTTSPSGIAWHPAGYAVVTAAEITGLWSSKLWAEAWIPGEIEPLWTYSRSDTEGIHWALDVAIGKLGWVYVVGVVDLGGPVVPAFVILYP